MSDPLLVVRWQAPGEHRVLAIHPEECWVWVLVGSGDWGGLVGTFRTATDDDEWAVASEIAAMLVDEPDAPADVLALTVSAAGFSRRVAASSDLAARIVDGFTSLLDRAREGPVSAFAVTATDRAPAGQSIVGVGFTSIGTDPVVLTVDADGAAGVAPDGSAVAIPPVRMGLVSAETTLLDGLYAPAELEPGVVGGWVLQVPAGASVATVRVVGTVRLAGAWPDGVPDRAFEGVCACAHP